MGNLNDWDFLIGNWRVRHRRLRQRLADCAEWDEFGGTCSSRKVLGGAGNVDDNALDFPGGPYWAVTLRAFDPVSGTWSIWWLDSRSPTHLDPPLVGRFENGAGIFYADHVFEETPIRVRFRWTGLNSGAPRWEQAFLRDGGNEWEVNWTMDFTKIEQSAGTPCCPVVELRQYTLHSGMRDQLIELFEREFIEPQEELGMRIIGTFRDLEKPDRFVWLRGFRDMETRATQLQQFYGGPIWKRHRDAANTTMIDSDNVLLLRPAGPEFQFDLSGCIRAEIGSTDTRTSGMIVATIFHLKESDAVSANALTEAITKVCTGRRIVIIGTFVTARYENTFPALPVREDANVLALFFQFADRATFERDYPFAEIGTIMAESVTGEPEMLFLAPTARSVLRGL